MAPFFRNSSVWVIDFQYEGRPRRRLKALPEGSDAPREAQALLQDLYSNHARLVGVRPATEQEDSDYRHGNLPRNAYCPSGKAPTTPPQPPEEEPDTA